MQRAWPVRGRSARKLNPQAKPAQALQQKIGVSRNPTSWFAVIAGATTSRRVSSNGGIAAAEVFQSTLWVGRTGEESEGQ